MNKLFILAVGSWAGYYIGVGLVLWWLYSKGYLTKEQLEKIKSETSRVN